MIYLTCLLPLPLSPPPQEQEDQSLVPTASSTGTFQFAPAVQNVPTGGFTFWPHPLEASHSDHTHYRFIGTSLINYKLTHYMLSVVECWLISQYYHMVTSCPTHWTCIIHETPFNQLPPPLLLPCPYTELGCSHVVVCTHTTCKAFFTFVGIWIDVLFHTHKLEIDWGTG